MLHSRSLIITLVFLSLTAAVAGAPNPDTVLLIDGLHVELTHPPVQKTGDVLVWVGDLARFGWLSIEKQGEGKLVTKREAVMLTFYHNRRIAEVNNLIIETTAPAEIISGRFMVPLGFVCRAFGFTCKTGTALVIQAETVPREMDSQPAATGANSIMGTVLYNGQPIAGVKVRAVDSRNVFVSGVASTTDEQGRYVLNGLPDGKFRPFVYTGDNPRFFNRIAEPVELKERTEKSVGPIHLGRVLTPIFPKPGQEVSPDGFILRLEWSPCPGAAGYHVTVTDLESEKIVLTREIRGTSLEVSVKELRNGRSYQWSVEAKAEDGAFLGGSPAGDGTSWTFTLSDVNIQEARTPGVLGLAQP